MSSYIYCPAYDDEMRNLMDQLHNNWSFSRIYGGGETPANGRTCISDVPNLSRVPQGTQLYLVVHGHGEMPLFVASQVFDGASDKKKRFWSAAELAHQMIDEGLTKHLQKLHMLVCHAGESVATIKEAKSRLSLFSRFRKASALGNEKEKTALIQKYSKLVQGKETSHYTSHKQVMPLGAQLYRELYSRGFTSLTITAYKAPVAQYIPTSPTQDGVFTPSLDLKKKGGAWGATIDKNPSQKMIINSKLFKLLGWKLNLDDTSDPLSCW